MTADIATSLASWSTTEGSNSPSGSTAISTNLDDNLRMVQAVVRTLASAGTIASAGTTDLSTVNDSIVTVTGTTTITALGTVSAGIWKHLVFSGALTLTHNATSLILPGGASITTAAGDAALVVSLGSGNWRCLSYTKADGSPVVSGVRLNAITAANGAGSLSNADYAQVWQWAITTASKVGFKFGESAASTGSGAYLVSIETLAASTANPFRVKARADSVIDQILVDPDGDVTISGGSTTDPAGAVTILGGVGSGSTAAGGPVTVAGGDTIASGGAGDLRLKAGDSETGYGGDVFIDAGQRLALTGTRLDGGSVFISGGDAQQGSTGNSNGGGIELHGGPPGGAGSYGDITFHGADRFMVADCDEQHLRFGGGAAPTISAGGGTGGTIAGRDQAFIVTMGTGSPTSVTVSFANTWTTAPVVTCMTTKTGVTLSLTAVSTTSVQITSSAAWSSSDKLHVICMGYE